MSKILKGVLLYSFITLGIILVMAMLVFGLMFITATVGKPFSFFGYKAMYVTNEHYYATLATTTNVLDGATYDLTINAGNFDVYVFQTNDGTSTVGVEKIDNLFGLYKTYEPEITFTSEEDSGNVSAVVTIAQPDGLVSFGDSIIKVNIPSEREFLLNLTIVTNAGDITIDGHIEQEENAKIQLNSLNITTNTGNFEVLNLGRAFSVSDTYKPQADVVLRQLSLNTQGGRFDLTDIDTLAILPFEDAEDEIEISANSGEFKFHNVLGYMNIQGTQVRIEANDIDTLGKGFFFNAPKGYFKINSLLTTDGSDESANTITTEVINVDIATITGYTAIQTTYGNIKVTTLNSNATLQSTHGAIEVGTANGNITAISQFGDIVISNYNQASYLKNTKGDITATFSGDVASETDYLSEVKNDDGNITLNNIYFSLDLDTTGSSTVVIDFDDLAQNAAISYDIKLASGNATLKVGSNPFRLIAKGDVRGSVGPYNIATLVSENGEEVEFPVLSAGADTALMSVNAGTGRATFSFKLV